MEEIYVNFDTNGGNVLGDIPGLEAIIHFHGKINIELL